MPKPLVRIEVRRPTAGAGVLDIHGDLTGAGEPALMDAYQRATSDGARVICLNFTQLHYMNSSGIGLLVTLLIRVQRQRQRLVAYGLSSHYQQIFDLTRLNEAITVYASEAAALGAAAV